jgi:hypothetical protein
VRLAGRVAVSFGRRLGILREGGSCRRMSAQLVLCRVVSMLATVQRCDAWSRAGGCWRWSRRLTLVGGV